MSGREVTFGTDGIRGVAGRWPCCPEVGVAMGRAAVRFAKASGPSARVLVGRDTRPSGAMLEAAVAAGVAGEGGACLLAGVLPTSGVALAVHGGLADVGVVITASHNPSTDNGFKVIGPRGAKLGDADLARIEGWLGTGPTDIDAPGNLANASVHAWTAWEDALTAAFPRPESLAGRRIAIDLAHGALVPAARWLVGHVPADWVVVGDGEGVINDGVGSEHLETLQAVVRGEGCDAGIAVDGDGDRCRIVDERGAIVPGDAVAWLLARFRGAEAIAVSVMSNGALERQLPGVSVRRTPVGDRFLREVLDRGEADLGSEESGHVLFSDFPAGDGLLTGLRTLEAAFADGGTTSAAFGAFAPLPRWLGKLGVRVRPALASVDGLDAQVRRAEAELGAFGRVFLRYSGTEPVLRLLVEGTNEPAVRRIGVDLRAWLAERIG